MLFQRTLILAGAAAAVFGIFGATASAQSNEPAEPAQCPDMSLELSYANGAVTTKVTPSNVNIKPATAGDPNSFHLHYFIDVDPATVITPGQPVPTGNPKIIHSGSLTQSVADLPAGPHQVWVVAGRLNHIPCAGGVQATVKFNAAPAPKPPATGDSLTSGDSSNSLLLAASVAAVLLGATAVAGTRAARK
jgi:hypothetical protein